MRQDTFHPTRSGLGFLVGLALTWLLVTHGFWAAPLIIGFLWAFIVSHRGWQFGGALLIAFIGYGLSLVTLYHGLPISREAQVTAEIMGFGHQGLLVFILTALLALLLAVAGTWVGRSLRLLIRPPAPRYRRLNWDSDS